MSCRNTAKTGAARRKPWTWQRLLEIARRDFVQGLDHPPIGGVVAELRMPDDPGRPATAVRKGQVMTRSLKRDLHISPTRAECHMT